MPRAFLVQTAPVTWLLRAQSNQNLADLYDCNFCIDFAAYLSQLSLVFLFIALYCTYIATIFMANKDIQFRSCITYKLSISDCYDPVVWVLCI